jgi:hypothetical protein
VFDPKLNVDATTWLPAAQGADEQLFLGAVFFTVEFMTYKFVVEYIY